MFIGRRMLERRSKGPTTPGLPTKCVHPLVEGLRPKSSTVNLELPRIGKLLEPAHTPSVLWFPKLYRPKRIYKTDDRVTSFIACSAHEVEHGK